MWNKPTEKQVTSVFCLPLEGEKQENLPVIQDL